VARLIYTALASLDGYTEGADGDFGWAAPDPEVHAFVNDLERDTGTHLYGRRMYETLTVWETDESLAAGSEVLADYARIWQAAEKVVYSRTLEKPVTEKTRIEREFEPEGVRALKEGSSTDLGIGGPELAAQALQAGLVDECRLLIAPVIVGAGKRWLPDGLRLDLELLNEGSFESGFVYLRYGVAGA
jgi:dihydrofolate reductase